MPYTPRAEWKEGEKGFPADLNKIEKALVTLSTMVVNVKETPYSAKGEGADETTKLQEAITAAGPPGEVGACFFPPGTYRVSSVLKIAAVGHIFGISQWTTVIETTSKTAYILRMEEAEIEIDHIWFKAKEIQTAGGAIDGRNFVNYGNIHDCTFGSNFFIGIDFSTALGGGATYMERLTFAEAGTGVSNFGTAIKIGDNVHLAAEYWISHILMLGNTTAGLKVGFDFNYCDSITMSDCLLFRAEWGVRTGNLGESKLVTGLKMTNVIMDTALNAGFYLVSYRDLTMTGCNAQTCGTGIVFAGKTAVMQGGCVQNCNEIGITINPSARATRVLGVTVNGNNTGNTAALAGIKVEKGSEEFQISDCYVSNRNLEGGGHQKKGLFIEKGKTKNFVITGNYVPKEATEQIAGIVNETEEAAEFYVVANNLEHV